MLLFSGKPTLDKTSDYIHIFKVFNFNRYSVECAISGAAWKIIISALYFMLNITHYHNIYKESTCMEITYNEST